MNSHIDDDTLLIQIREGNSHAFNLLYDRYFEEIYLHILSKTNDYELTKDLTHDIFLKIWESRDKLTSINNLRGYLFISARNKVLDLIAHHKIIDKYYESFIQTYQLTESTDFKVREKQIEAIINEAIESLPLKMKEIFELSRRQHLSYKEISEKLSISEKTVKTQINNALKKMKQKLHPYTYFFLF